MLVGSISRLEVPAVHERLYRSREDRMLFGVAGGMADWLDMDPAVVRIVWALLIFAAGMGVLLYIVAAIVIPEEPLDRADVPIPMSGSTAGTAAAGAGVPTEPGPVSDAAAGEGGRPGREWPVGGRGEWPVACRGW